MSIVICYDYSYPILLIDKKVRRMKFSSSKCFVIELTRGADEVPFTLSISRYLLVAGANPKWGSENKCAKGNQYRDTLHVSDELSQAGQVTFVSLPEVF